MVALSKVARAFATALQLLPTRRHEHVWNDEMCDPTACMVTGCGKTRKPPLRRRIVAAIEDALDVDYGGD